MAVLHKLMARLLNASISLLLMQPVSFFVAHAACQLQSIKSLTVFASELSIPPRILDTELYKPLQA